MANPTNVSIMFSTNGIDPLLLCARALAEFFAEPKSFLNVSRQNTAVFTLILFIKNAIACYGIANIVPVPVTIQLLITVSCYSVVLLAGSYVLNFTLIWASFATVLCFTSPVIPLPAIARLILSVATLCAAPVYFRVPCTIECVVDILMVIHLSWYLLTAFLGPVEKIAEHIFLAATVIMVFLAIDIAFDVKGYGFMMLVLLAVFLPTVVDAFLREKLLSCLVMTAIFCYCSFEQAMIYQNRLANITKT